MKIGLRLASVFWSDEDNEFMHHNPTIIEWNLPFIPKAGECMGIEDIKVKRDVDMFLCWVVSDVVYEVENGEWTVVIDLNGH